MPEKRVLAVGNLITPNKPLAFDEHVCNGCNRCVEACLMDILIPNPEKGKPPIILYPDECFYEGSCVMECPRRDKGAIKLNWPLVYKMRWKRKETGEHYRLGMSNPPPPNSRPPVGGWNATSAEPSKKKESKKGTKS